MAATIAALRDWQDADREEWAEQLYRQVCYIDTIYDWRHRAGEWTSWLGELCYGPREAARSDRSKADHGHS